MSRPRAGHETGDVVWQVDRKVIGNGRFFGFGHPLSGLSSSFYFRVVERSQVQDRRQREAVLAAVLLWEVGWQEAGELCFGNPWSLLA